MTSISQKVIKNTEVALLVFPLFNYLLTANVAKGNATLM